MEKQFLKFRKYTNKEDFNLAREKGEITPGTITYVESTKELYEGSHHRYKTVKGNDIRGGGQVVVDKIWKGNYAYLPCTATNGYRIGVAKNQTVCLSICDIGQGGTIDNVQIMGKLTLDDIKYYMPYLLDVKVEIFETLVTTRVNSSNYPYSPFIVYKRYGYSFDSIKPEAVNSNFIERSAAICTSANSYNYICLVLNRGLVGYYEMTNGKWVFHVSHNMVGNNGTRYVSNGEFHYTSKKFDKIHLDKAIHSNVEEGLTILRDYYERLSKVTQRNYKLFYKSKRKKNTASQTRWEHLKESKSRCYRVWNGSFNNPKYLFGEWVHRDKLPRDMCKKFRYTYNKELNTIDRLYKVEYVDFKVGFFEDEHQEQVLQDDHCIDFRLVFGKNQIYIK